MAIEREIRGDGTPVELDGVTVSSTGLWGSVTAWSPEEATRGGRGATAAGAKELQDVLGAAGFEEQYVVEVSGDVEATTSGGSTRGTADAALTAEVTPAPPGWAQVALLQDEDGVVTWHVADDVAEGRSLDATRGGTRTFSLPVWQPERSPTGTDRGLLGSIGRKIVKLLAFKVLEEGGNLVADLIVRRWEERKRPHRLRRFTPGDYRLEKADPLGPDDFRRLASGPALLLVHGTSTRSHSGFARLPETTVKELNQRYGDRVIAFDHPTVAVHPEDNVRWLAGELAARLGPDQRLDLSALTHSRGGLVARLIAEHGERLGLRGGQVKVHELVMVGTPSTGTPFADTAHFERYVDIMTNLMSLIPENPVTDVLEVLVEVVKHLAVGVHAGLDGLGSMRPGGDFLDALNTGGLPGVRYRAVASDYEPRQGSALARIARDLAVDKVVFRGEANDLIVPERGVYEGKGVPAITDALRFATDDGVDHSGYWADARVNAHLLDWLRP